MSPLTPLPPDPPDVKEKLLTNIKQHLLSGRFTDYAPPLEAVYLLLKYLCTLSDAELRDQIPVHEKTYPNDLSFGAIWITLGKAKWGSASAFKMGGGGTPCPTKYGDMKKWASSNVDGIVIREFRLPGNDDLRLKFVDRATRNKRKRKSITKALVLSTADINNEQYSEISSPLQIAAPDSPSILVRSVRPRPLPPSIALSRLSCPVSSSSSSDSGVDFMALPALTMSLPQELRANQGGGGPTRITIPQYSTTTTIPHLPPSILSPPLLRIKMEPAESSSSGNQAAIATLPKTHTTPLTTVTLPATITPTTNTSERADVMAAFELVRLSASGTTPIQHMVVSVPVTVPP